MGSSEYGKNVIERISPVPSFGAAALLSSQQLIEIFGTEKPERNMIEQKRNEIQGIRDRWEATYIIVYKNSKPDEIFFAGFSGD